MTGENVPNGEVRLVSYEVRSVSYSVHIKRDNPHGHKSMRVEYEISSGQFRSEWVCFEHYGRARAKAERWWQRRSSEPVPDTVAYAIRAIDEHGLLEPTRITVRRVSGEQYDTIVDYDLPAKDNAGVEEILSEDELPF